MPAGDRRRSDILRGELFDYLASGVLILALTPAGVEIARISRTDSHGMVGGRQDVDGIRKLLLETFHRWEAGGLAAVEPDRAAIYSLFLADAGGAAFGRNLLEGAAFRVPPVWRAIG